jgi:hypothetical protein
MTKPRRLRRMCIKCGTTIQMNVSCYGWDKEREVHLMVCGLCAEDGFFNSKRDEVLSLPLKRNKTVTNWLTRHELETEGVRPCDRRV